MFKNRSDVTAYLRQSASTLRQRSSNVLKGTAGRLSRSLLK
jgi:hypothetical protein